MCNAHHLRELVGIAELTGQKWPTELADLLVDMHVQVEQAKDSILNKLSAGPLAEFKRKYGELVAAGKSLNPPPAPTGKCGRPKLGPAGALLARLEKHQDDVQRFATDFRVPFDNNQAERDIRMVKLQQKISGGWHSETGARAFLAVRSYLSTANKHRPKTNSKYYTNYSTTNPGNQQPTAHNHCHADKIGQRYRNHQQRSPLHARSAFIPGPE